MACRALRDLASTHRLNPSPACCPVLIPTSFFSVLEYTKPSETQDLALAKTFLRIFTSLAPSDSGLSLYFISSERPGWASLSHCPLLSSVFTTFPAQTSVFIHVFACLSSASTTAPQITYSLMAEPGWFLTSEFFRDLKEQCQSYSRFSGSLFVSAL